MLAPKRESESRHSSGVGVDTCYIDKTSSEELTISLNSMFEYYHRAAVCYAYLYDVPDLKSLDPKQSNQKSMWFERGWTL